MHKYLFLIILMVIFTACSPEPEQPSSLEINDDLIEVRDDEIEILNNKIKELESVILDIEGEAVINENSSDEEVLNLKEEIRILEVNNEQLTLDYQSLLEYKDSDSESEETKVDYYDEYMRLRDQIMGYLMYDSEYDLDEEKRNNTNEDLSIGGIHLYMNKSEVIDIKGECDSIKFSYYLETGQFEEVWHYEDGSMMIFNPVYLVYYSVSDNDINTNLGVEIGGSLKDNIGRLREKFDHKTSLYDLNSSGDNDFFYHEETNTCIFLMSGDNRVIFNEVSEKDTLTHIAIEDYDWIYLN